MLFNVLKKYDVETIEKSKNKLPIIFECFELESLQKFETLSDLPMIYLMNKWSMDNHKLSDIAKVAHGIGPTVTELYKGTFFEEAKALNL
jgi:hypothetical protein